MEKVVFVGSLSAMENEVSQAAYGEEVDCM